ncbi:MAG: hypothetical protein KKA05_02410 [Alphaproteobacteria bacterium]|nr:hypothetical protein [Alphaproteobacteria bacterium]
MIATLPPAQKRVLVFAAPGADWRTVCHSLREIFAQSAAPIDVIPVTPAQMRVRGMLDPAQTLGFVLPGASDADYDTKLGADNIAALRMFVHDGGRFLGICAGAFYACREIEWYSWDADRQKNKRPGIDFFNYRAHGPIRPLLAPTDTQTAHDRSLSHVAIADLGWHDGTRTRQAHVMYWGGPHFDGTPDANTHIIARFNNVAGNPPAIVMREYGKGRALISSVHPEIRGRDFAKAVYGQGLLQDRSRMIGNVLESREHGRAALWHNLVHRLFPAFVP